MKRPKSYTVLYERDPESGWWVARVPVLQGCLTQGRTITQARERIREAIALVLDLPGLDFNGELVDDVRMPAPVRRKLTTQQRAAQRAAAAARKAQDATREAVRALIGSGLSMADAGELLGVSKQRAHQLSKDDG